METYSYLKPSARVTQSALTKHYVVDATNTTTAQGYRSYDDALAEAEVRTARELRSMATVYERSARLRATEPELLGL